MKMFFFTVSQHWIPTLTWFLALSVVSCSGSDALVEYVGASVVYVCTKGQVGSCLRFLFWRPPIAKNIQLCRFKQILWCQQTPLACCWWVQLPFNAAWDKVITVYHHHCLSSSVFLIILYIASDITLTLSCACIQHHLCVCVYIR